MKMLLGKCGCYINIPKVVKHMLDPVYYIFPIDGNVKFPIIIKPTNPKLLKLDPNQHETKARHCASLINIWHLQI